MKADFQKLSSSNLQSSFIDFWVKDNSFGFHWHYHPELEICYIKQGRGKRIIGQNIENFNNGDLVLVGSNVPHSWITDEQFNESDDHIENFVIQFRKEIFEPFSSLPEFNSILKLLEDARRGIRFSIKDNPELIDSIKGIETTEGYSKLRHLFDLLHRFVQAEHRFLNASSYKISNKKDQESRILKVCNYIHEHYKDQLQIEELANLINMNNSAFCRFFKNTLGKTVIQYINELRITYICNQLQNTREPIYQLAFDTGYSSIAHFNRQFKKIMGRTPSQYKNLIQPSLNQSGS